MTSAQRSRLNKTRNTKTASMQNRMMWRSEPTRSSSAQKTDAPAPHNAASPRDGDPDCRGECPKNRIIRTADGEPGLNYFCRGFKHYCAHAIPEVERIVADLRKQPVQPRKRM